MQREHRITYIFDIENYQSDYTKCIAFINLLEQKDKFSNDQKLKLLQDIIDTIQIRGTYVPEGIAARYLEEPLEKKNNKTAERKVSIPPAQRGNILTRDNFNLAALIASQNNEPAFHIRININVKNASALSSLMNLQYLALLLQNLDYLIVGKSTSKKRLSVFFVPETTAYYPYQDEQGKIDTDTYRRVSRFLRLLSKEYTGVLYGVDEIAGTPVIQALNFKDAHKTEDCFPLIPMKEKSYKELFEERLEQGTIQLLFNLQTNKRFQEANNEDPVIALKDFVAETAYKKLSETIDAINADRKLIGSYLQKVLFKNTSEDGIFSFNWITFALFCYILHLTPDCVDDEALITKEIKAALTLSESIGAGLKQVVQNAIQHSDKHSCVFSFYAYGLEEAKLVYSMSLDYEDVDKIFEEYATGLQRSILEIQILDLNHKQTMIDNFIENLEWEYTYNSASIHPINLEGYSNLLRLSKENAISIGNFFNYFTQDSIKDAWYDFRCADSSAHIGLSLFAQTAKRCKASIKVISNTTYKPSVNQLFQYSYAFDHNKTSQFYELFNEDEYSMIPGTQFYIQIPIVPIRYSDVLGMSQLSNIEEFNEDYKTFAQFIDYTAQPLFVRKLFDEKYEDTLIRNHANARDKFYMQLIWTSFWNEAIQSSKNVELELSVFYIDAQAEFLSEYFMTSDNCEVFLKGLFNLGETFRQDRKIYFAVTNVSDLFLNTVKQVCISLASKPFPDNLQLFFCDCPGEKQVQLFGASFEEAVRNAYLLSIEHGTSVFDHDDIEVVQYLTAPFKEKRENDNAMPDLSQNRAVMPFDAILPTAANEQKKFFDNKIEKLAEYAIDSKQGGYKLEKTHMRLGSKVHILSFYEMSFLFYRTSVANRVAFELLQDIRNNEYEYGINILTDTILFYGYASYSKAILTSLTEILKEYRASYKENIAFASFQHNLQTEMVSDEIQLYFDFSEGFQGSVSSDNIVELPNDTKIIQIVPISSTLTTFEKMWKRLERSLKNPSRAKIKANYTVFWVSDEENGLEEPSDTERNYWNKVYPDNRSIESDILDLNEVNRILYLMRTIVTWKDPLKCNLCFPEYVVNEIPLVETDPTSTVPTQQIRGERGQNKLSAEEYSRNNCERIKDLEDCVYYGHIRRSKNHYQFYIDTQKYYTKVKDKIRTWLREEKLHITEKNGAPVLKIIFSPEHSTNVGFSQYVNTYYFNGMAEVISVNEDKEYRSNFICEHDSLIKNIQRLHEKWDASSSWFPVEFYFADDTITTGATINKANSLLRSLLPLEYSNLYPIILFKKCFLLVDRISIATKSTLVRDAEKDFLSYVHIDISNTRKHGDSCVGCKLEQEAMRLFKRSATRNNANYWAKKATDYEPIAFDDMLGLQEYQKNSSFERLVISHIAQNVIFQDNDPFVMGNTYNSILFILYKLLGKKHKNNSVNFKYDVLINAVIKTDQKLDNSKILNSSKILIKLISRPFFSYDFKVRMQVMSLLIIISEALLDRQVTAKTLNSQIMNSELGYNDYLREGNYVESTLLYVDKLYEIVNDGKNLLRFLQECLLEALADMRSTYLIRKETIRKVYNLICKTEEENGELICEKEKKGIKCRNLHDTKDCGKDVIYCFWKSYAAYVHRIIDSSTDETRALWLEYLLMFGNEYNGSTTFPQDNANEMPILLYSSITGRKVGRNIHQKKDLFYIFCNEIFLQNNRILFDGIEKSERSSSKDGYFMECWKKACRWNQKWISDQIIEKTQPLDAEVDLYSHINTKDSKDVTQSYDDLIQKISIMIQRKYNVEKSAVNIALVVKSGKADEPMEMAYFDVVTSSTSYAYSEKARCKYVIKERIIDALNNGKNCIGIEKIGYYIEYADDMINIEKYQEAEKNIQDENHRKPYIILLFDNPQIEIKTKLGRKMKPITQVFLYISIQVLPPEKRNLVPWLVLRDILSYRNRILRLLEENFNGDIMAKYAHTVGQKNILEHEKAASHATSTDERISLEIFEKNHYIYKVLGKKDVNEVAKWLLLRNYVNSQIAKLFNRSFRDDFDLEHGTNNDDIPKLYLSSLSKYNNDDENKFKKRLTNYNDLGLELDGRFALVKAIADIQYIDLEGVEFFFAPGSQDKRYYNVEFFSCVLLDIFFTSIKYKTEKEDFLLRVDHFLNIQNRLNNSDKLSGGRKESLLRQQCVITVSREDGEKDKFDYLIIRNAVDPLANHIFSDWQFKNKEIVRRLNNPLDYADGHMSLLTIKRYIEGLHKTLHGKTEFRYCTKEELMIASDDKKVYDMHDLWFETKLPVLLPKQGGMK